MEQKEAKPWGIWLAAMLLGLLALLLAGSGIKKTQFDAPAAVQCLGSGEKMVVPVGRTVGIKLFSRGVMVVGLADVATEQGEQSPARACGLRTGDIIAVPLPVTFDIKAATRADLTATGPAGQLLHYKVR